MEISRMEMSNNQRTSFRVGNGRFRVQEQFGNEWVLIDDWYGEEVVKSESYEDAFKAIADYNEALEEAKEKARREGIELFDRVTKLIGAQSSMTCAGYKEINEKYRITVCREYFNSLGVKKAHIKMSLTTTGKKRVCIAAEFIENSFTDKMIENRYNKLMRAIEE